MRILCSWLGILGTLALAGVPIPAGAQALGAEFQVNTYTTGRQTPGFFFIGGNVAADANGAFVIVWRSEGQDGKGWDILGQRYDATGAPSGAEFRVNSLTAGDQNYPSVSSDAAGNFVVVWDAARFGYGQGNPPGCFGQRYDAAGVPQGTQFRIKDSGPNARFPAVASAADGNFVVVWLNSVIFGQRYDSQGVAQGRRVKVDRVGVAPAVASDSAGNFVVVWAEPGSGYGGTDGYVFGQRFDRDGVPRGRRFEIDSTFLDSWADPAVASSANGTFVVVWSDFDSYGGNGYDIFGQRYDSDGGALGARFQVNTYTTDQQEHPSVASDASGNFLVAWQDRFQDGSGRGVFGQRYDSDGAAQGGEFRVNTFTTGDQRKPSASAVGTNRFVVVWESDNQDGSDEGVFGQRYDFDAADATAVGSPDARYP